MKTITMAAGALAVLMTSGASFAQAPANDETRPVAGISQEDFLARAEARFERLDADGDGTLTRDERRAERPGRGERRGPDGGPAAQTAERVQNTGPQDSGPQGPGPHGPGMGPMGDVPPPAGGPQGGPEGGPEDGPEHGPMARMDSDGDGRITVEDFVERAEERFADLDENGDGEIASDEMKRPHHGPRGPRHAREDGWKTHGPRHAGFEHDRGDGISEEAFMERAQERFDAMDADGDGTVTREERHDARDDRGYGHQWRHNWR